MRFEVRTVDLISRRANGPFESDVDLVLTGGGKKFITMHGQESFVGSDYMLPAFHGRDDLGIILCIGRPGPFAFGKEIEAIRPHLHRHGRAARERIPAGKGCPKVRGTKAD